MKSLLSVAVLVGFGLALVVGCGGEPKPKMVETLPTELMSANPPGEELTPVPTPPGNVVSTPDLSQPVTPPTNGDASTEPASPTGPGNLEAAPVATERVVAEQGAAIKGRSLDEFEGVLVTPAKTYFSVRERVVFEIQVPQALNLYKAASGEAPKSHDEFMAQIIEANMIQLPELAAGHKYIYDPATEELMVERPRS